MAIQWMVQDVTGQRPKLTLEHKQARKFRIKDIGPTTEPKKTGRDGAPIEPPKTNRRRLSTADERNRARELYRKGYSVRHISFALDRAWKTINSWVKEK